MSTDEEYLDSLLKSMEENPVANRTDFPSIFQEEEPLKEKTVFKDIEPEETESFTENIISALNVARTSFLGMKKCVLTVKLNSKNTEQNIQLVKTEE